MVETTEQYRTRINQLKTSIENEPLIKKMRDDIAEGISKTGNRQADTEVRQDTLEDDFVAVQQDASSASPSGAEVAVARGSYSTLDQRLTEEEQKVTAQFAQTDLQLNYKKKQTILLAQFYKKLMQKEVVKMIGQGDSLMYGQDSVSVDKRPADTIAADDGSLHTATRATTSITESLQAYLREVYNTNSTVINKGYSGDWTERSYNRWNKNSNADLAFVMLGTNDSNQGADWVPANVRGNVNKYIVDMRKLIERYLDWNTPLILFTPTRLMNQEDPTKTTGHNTEPFRTALFMLGDEYGVPVVDSEVFLNGCDNSYYSDSVHLNGKGYSYYSSRMMGIFIGYGVKNPVQLKSGDVLSVRSTRDNFVMDGGYLSTSSSSWGPEESTDKSGALATFGSNTQLHYGIETMEDNLILIPIYANSGLSEAKTSLDFGIEQGSTPLLNTIYKSGSQGFKPLSEIKSKISTNDSSFSDGKINNLTTDRFLHITNKGWHSLSFGNSGLSGELYFNGFIVLSYEDFYQRSNKNSNYVFSTHSSYDGSSPVSTSIINIDELSRVLNFTQNSSEFWKNEPLKITILNYNNSVITYILQVGQTTVNNGWSISTNPVEYNLVATPNESINRRIGSIQFDPTTRMLTINWSNSLTRATTITISKL